MFHPLDHSCFLIKKWIAEWNFGVRGGLGKIEVKRRGPDSGTTIDMIKLVR